MLADGEELEAELVRETRLLEQVLASAAPG